MGPASSRAQAMNLPPSNFCTCRPSAMMVRSCPNRPSAVASTRVTPPPAFTVAVGFPSSSLLKVDHGRRRGRDLLGLGRRQGLGQENRQQYANGKDSILHDSTSSDFVSNLKIYPNYLEVPSCKAKLMGGWAANPGLVPHGAA